MVPPWGSYPPDGGMRNKRPVLTRNLAVYTSRSPFSVAGRQQKHAISACFYRKLACEPGTRNTLAVGRRAGKTREIRLFSWKNSACQGRKSGRGLTGRTKSQLTPAASDGCAAKGLPVAREVLVRVPWRGCVRHCESSIRFVSAESAQTLDAACRDGYFGQVGQWQLVLHWPGSSGFLLLRRAWLYLLYPDPTFGASWRLRGGLRL